MKRNARKGLVLSLCMGMAFSVALGIQSSGYGYASAEENTATSIARQEGLTVDGFSVRVNVSEEDTTGEGVRFHVGMTNALYESLLNTEKTAFKDGVTTGTVVISSYALGDMDLTKDTANARVVDTTEKWNVVKNENNQVVGMQSIVYVWDIPTTEYGTDIAVVGYINDNGVVTYSDQAARSMSWVANEEYNDVNSKFDADMKAELKDSYIDKKVTLNNGNESTTKTVSYGETLSVDNPTVAAGYTFDGWYNKTGTAKWDMEKPVSNPMNLYAKITANTNTKYYVILNKDGVDATAELAESFGLTENPENGKYYLTGTTDTTADITDLANAKCPSGYVYEGKTVNGMIAGDESLSLTVDYWSKAADEFISYNTQAKLTKYVTSAPLWPSASHTGSVTQSVYAGEVGGETGNFLKLVQEQSSMHYSPGPQIKIASVNTAQELLDHGYTHILFNVYYEGGANKALKLYQNTNSAANPVLATLARNAWTPVKIDLQDVKTFMDANGTYNLMINNGGGSVGYSAMTMYMSDISAVKEVQNEFLVFDDATKLSNYVTSAPLWPNTSYTGSVTQSFYAGEVGGETGNYLKIEQEQSSMHYSVGPQIKLSSVNTVQELLDRGYTHIVFNVYYEGGAKSALTLYQNTNSASNPVLATLTRSAWTPVEIDLQQVKTFMDANGTYNLMINNGGGTVGYKAMTLYMSSIYAITK